MNQCIEFILHSISFFHLNILFILGLAIFGGTLGGRFFQRLKIPQVVGYIVIGIILGKGGFNVISSQMIDVFQPFNYFALGLIGFMIGGELKKTVLTRYGKKFFQILLWEGLLAFIFVTLLIGFFGVFFLENFKTRWALAVVLGAIASATAPAATTDVLWEYRSRGPLTTIILGIVALDDALAIFLFAIASSLAIKIIGLSQESLLLSILHPIYEIMGAMIIGWVSGVSLVRLLQKYGQSDRILALFIGTVLFVLGLAQSANVSVLLTALTLGTVVVNRAPQLTKRLFRLTEGFTPPIYILFFVLVGARLNFNYLNPLIFGLIFLYLIGRTSGKMLGATVGSYISQSSNAVKRYLPLCLFSQAGVAIGLSIVTSQIFPQDIGSMIVIVIASTTFIVQIIGPPCVKYAIVNAKEAGLNVTEADLIQETKLTDLMDEHFPIINQTDQLNKILEIFSEYPYFYYPVVNQDKKIQGIISIDTLRQVFKFSEMNNLLLAADIMDPVKRTISFDQTAQEVKDFFDLYHLDFVPVVDKDHRVLGCIEARIFHQIISKKIFEAEQKAMLLDEQK